MKLQEFKQRIEAIGIMDSTSRMEGINDGIITFHAYEANGSFHELCIIADDITVYNGISVEELLDTKDIKYLSYRFFMANEPSSKDAYSQVGESIDYRADDDYALNGLKDKIRSDKNGVFVSASDLLKKYNSANERLKQAIKTYICFDMKSINKFQSPFDEDTNNRINEDVDKLTDIAFKELWERKNKSND